MRTAASWDVVVAPRFQCSRKTSTRAPNGAVAGTESTGVNVPIALDRRDATHVSTDQFVRLLNQPPPLNPRARPQRDRLPDVPFGPWTSSSGRQRVGDAELGRRSAGSSITSSITNGRGPLRASDRQRALEAGRPYTLPRMVARIPLGRAFIIASLVALGTVSCLAQVAFAAPPAARADAALTRALNGLVAMPGGPVGVVAVVQRGQRPSLFRAGVADLRTGREISANDYVRIASISKAFSGAVALSLVARGRLSLNDTIGGRLPSLPKAWAQVTLREVLQHTSGLPDYTSSKEFGSELMKAPHSEPSLRKLVSFVEREPLVFTPRTHYTYSNTDNLVVALMVQAVTRRSYQQELASQVFGPLGLHRTSLPAGFRLPSPFIHGYDYPSPHREDQSTLVSMAWLSASGGIVSTPAELNRFIRGYVSGRLFGRSVQRQQLRLVNGDSEPIGPGANQAGLGIFRYQTRCGTIYGHTGNFLGYTQFAASTLDGRRSVTVSANEQLNVQLR
jgi:D-alanyl-D-alanine carboxypeptidase